ncbi:MAG: hypothetical protein HC822_25460 [Oscillochloris sp.]|nr:hypothetical protein [Oscillochloris sp.]
MLLSRVLVVYLLTWISNRWRGKVPLAYQHVQFWGGLRGAISLALVLSLPASFADRNLLLVMTFGMVVFTLLVQGTTMNNLLQRLHLVQREAAELEYERRHGRLMAARAAHRRVSDLHAMGMISTTTWDQLEEELTTRVRAHQDAQQMLLNSEPSLYAAELEDTRREALRAERITLMELLSSGVISEHIYSELVGEIDIDLSTEHPGRDPVEQHDAELTSVAVGEGSRQPHS